MTQKNKSVQFATAAEFLKAIEIQPEPFEVPDLGWIEVRSLTMDEIGHIRSAYKDDAVQQVILAVATGVVTPPLSEEAVSAMHKGKSKVVTTISNKIFELTNQGKGE